MAAKLSLASVILMVAAAVFFLLAVFFFLLFNIPSVISDLSGRTAKRSINRLRAANEKSSSKFYGPTDHNKERIKLTEDVKKTEPPEKSKKKIGKNGVKKELVFASADDRPETGLLNENRADAASSQNETTALSPEGVTEELQINNGDFNETMDLLGDRSNAPTPRKREDGIKLSILDEVILIHTDEVIK